jgi:TRAP-type C4-dicarboxylate transport system substrate-binding protein
MYNYIVLLISKKTWDKFNDEEKSLVTQVADEAKQHQQEPGLVVRCAVSRRARLRTCGTKPR